jgi:hypothetical protein
VGKKTKEDAIGVAMSGRLFHNNPIPVEYAKVLIHEITNMTCIDYLLDHVMPEGIKELGEAVNHFEQVIRPVQPKYLFRPNEQVL